MRASERYAKRVGSVVGNRWRIDSLLGWGSTAAVYAATHRNGHRAALKIIHQALCSDETIVERFLREAGIANAIKHRAIVTINDDGITEEGCAFLVAELLEGETLEQRRERTSGRIDLEEFAELFEELMSAIAAVHAAGIVHRDLKPGNVFITKDRALKLLDFGTARVFDRAPGSQLSGQGLVLGTPAYMSPEQARGARAEVDAQSDVWSLGAMIFTILSGEYVHPGRDHHMRLIAAASQQARSLSTVAPSVDDRVAAVVDRALSFAKNDRYPDVQTMRIAFRQAIVTAMPTMRELRAFADVSTDGPSQEDVAPGTISMSVPTIAAADSAIAPAARESDSEPAPPAVSATQRAPRPSTGIPLPALAIGISAVAAMGLLVAFFISGGDQSTTTAARSAPLVDPPHEEQPALLAPSASFIVISAPDTPIPEEKGTPATSTTPEPEATDAGISKAAGGRNSPVSRPLPAAVPISGPIDLP